MASKLVGSDVQLRLTAVLGTAFYDVGAHLFANKHYADARALFAHAEARFTQCFGPASFEATDAAHRIAACYREGGDLPASLEKYRSLRQVMQGASDDLKEMLDYVIDNIDDLERRVKAAATAQAFLRAVGPPKPDGAR